MKGTARKPRLSWYGSKAGAAKRKPQGIQGTPIAITVVWTQQETQVSKRERESFVKKKKKKKKIKKKK
jgi:hypothetical protein